MLHKSIATLLGLANKAEICGPKFRPAKSAQVCSISVSVTVSILLKGKTLYKAENVTMTAFLIALKHRATPAGPKKRKNLQFTFFYSSPHNDSPNSQNQQDLENN